MNLLVPTERGLYCPAGDFYIDPSRAVPRAIVTHAHSDHAVKGCGKYLASSDGLPILTQRLNKSAWIEPLAYGSSRKVKGVRISLHPAGHVLGSVQVRLEFRGHVWVVTGDYKRQADPTCLPFEPVKCDVFLTETTFGLPIYRWPATHEVIAQIHRWWRENRERGVSSVLGVYALGKAQRLLASLDPSIGPIHVHESIEVVNAGYRAAGVRLPKAETQKASSGALVLTVPSAFGTPWLNRFAPYDLAYASGWMRTRKQRQQRGVGRAFVLSDHVDWPALLNSIQETQATRIGAMHGFTQVVARYLNERGFDAFEIGNGRSVQTARVESAPDELETSQADPFQEHES